MADADDDVDDDDDFVVFVAVNIPRKWAMDGDPRNSSPARTWFLASSLLNVTKSP